MNRPYFDDLPRIFASNDTRALEAFGRHIHWGFWPDPALADGSIEDFSAAADRLSQKILGLVKLQEGMKILDAGCGFGGTISLLNASGRDLQLKGININAEQIARAKVEVVPRSDNQIEFICGDACALPFADKSFDAVLAVECIFAFPSREQFFAEVKRVLVPGGTLVLCDFLLPNWFGPVWQRFEGVTNRVVKKSYGEFTAQGNPPVHFWTFSQYGKLAIASGFQPVQIEDITRNTLPTYPVVNQLMKEVDPLSQSATEGLATFSRLGLVRYVILSYKASGKSYGD